MSPNYVGVTPVCDCDYSLKSYMEILLKKKRGFGSMDKDKQRRIAALGGRTAHIRGTAHEWTSEEARKAGKKARSLKK